jgi:hypothetical protein
MRSSSIRAAWLAALAAALLAPGLRAQVETAKPITLGKPAKVEKFRGEVLYANRIQMIVRSLENEKVVRTFSYSAEVREKMEKILERGGFQHGDKVEIHTEPGKDVALRIKGKPSKPRTD